MDLSRRDPSSAGRLRTHRRLPVRILLAPDKFKGSFTAEEICRLLAEGIHQADPGATVTSCPMADGGDGTLDVLLGAIGGARETITAAGPLGGTVQAPVAFLSDGAALIESAKFCGPVALGGREKDPMRASTFGLGVAVRETLARSPARLLLGVGGSATVDGGLGLASALGYRLRDRTGSLLQGTGRDLSALCSIEPPGDGSISAQVVALVDVSHTLLGPAGAARVFGPQKGASPEQVEELEEGLANLAARLSLDLGVGVADLEGGGAGGGLGAAAFAFLGARITSGASTVAELTGLRLMLEKADLVVTGEGAFNASHSGKVVGEVARLCAALDQPLIVVCARTDGPPPPGRARVVTLGAAVNRSDLVQAGKALARGAFSRD